MPLRVDFHHLQRLRLSQVREDFTVARFQLNCKLWDRVTVLLPCSSCGEKVLLCKASLALDERVSTHPARRVR